MKKLIIVIFVLLLATGCQKNLKFTPEERDNREAIVVSIGKTNEEKIVIKEQNKKREDLYYVYQITNNTYTEYLYTFHNSQKTFDEAIQKYSTNIYYEFYKYDAYVTRITLEKNVAVLNANVKDAIMKKHADHQYQIVE